MSVGTIRIIEMLVIRFMMVFTLFDMMDAKASIVPVKKRKI